MIEPFRYGRPFTVNFYNYLSFLHPLTFMGWHEGNFLFAFPLTGSMFVICF